MKIMQRTMIDTHSKILAICNVEQASANLFINGKCICLCPLCRRSIVNEFEHSWVQNDPWLGLVCHLFGVPAVDGWDFPMGNAIAATMLRPSWWLRLLVAQLAEHKSAGYKL